MYLPDEARFSNLLNLPEGENIGMAVNDAMRAVEAENEELKDVLPKTYNWLENDTLVALLRNFAEIPMDVEGDVFGRIYEYFLGKFAMSEGQRGGEFFTPTSIVKLIVEVMEPYHGRILDPACGSGGMFVQSARFVQVVWELTGGIARCGECGRSMTTVHIPPRGNSTKSYHYYRCSGVVEKKCKNKNHRAEALEDQVVATLKQLFEDHTKYELLINDFFDRHIREFKRRNPERESKIWAERITTLKAKLSKAQDLAIEGLLTKEDLMEKAHQIKEEMAIAESELMKLSQINKEVERLERSREIILKHTIADDLFRNYSSSDGEGNPTDIIEIDASEQRFRLYKDMNLKVWVSSEIDMELEIAGQAFSKLESTSSR